MTQAKEPLIALVTGANKGIGWETARQLGARGMRVIAAARDPERGHDAAERLRAAGCDARFLPLDVTDADSITQAARTLEAEYGRLDVLVCNAGITEGKDPPSRTQVADLRKVFEVNVFGAIAVTVALLPLLEKSPQPRIVQVSSQLGSLHSLGDPSWDYGVFNHVPYCASKAALNMFTVLLARELQDRGFKVNSAAPGYTATDLNDNSGPQTVEEGARASLQLATLEPHGPTGGFFDQRQRIAW